MKQGSTARIGWFTALGTVLAATLLQLISNQAGAYDSSVYNNLMRTRDALLQQRDYLRRSADETSKQLDQLQQKMARINNYLDQNDKNLRDIDAALGQYR
jgi:uncharacterized coiled-coil DUF342 family protein